MTRAGQLVLHGISQDGGQLGGHRHDAVVAALRHRNFVLAHGAAHVDHALLEVDVVDLQGSGLAHSQPGEQAQGQAHPEPAARFVQQEHGFFPVGQSISLRDSE